MGKYPRRIWPWQDGLRRIFLGKLPSVRYTGYAVLLRNVMSWVLLEEMIMGTMVAFLFLVECLTVF